MTTTSAKNKKDYDAIERGTTETSTLLDPSIIASETNSRENRAFVLLASLAAAMMVLAVVATSSSSSAMMNRLSAALAADSDEFVLPTYCAPPNILSKSRHLGSMIECGDILKCGKVYNLQQCLFEFECDESCADPYRDMTNLTDFFYRNIPYHYRTPEFGGPAEW